MKLPTMGRTRGSRSSLKKRGWDRPLFRCSCAFCEPLCSSVSTNPIGASEIGLARQQTRQLSIVIATADHCSRGAPQIDVCQEGPRQSIDVVTEEQQADCFVTFGNKKIARLASRQFDKKIDSDKARNTART